MAFFSVQNGEDLNSTSKVITNSLNVAPFNLAHPVDVPTARSTKNSASVCTLLWLHTCISVYLPIYRNVAITLYVECEFK